MAAKPETAIATRIIKWIKVQGGDAWSVHGSAFQRVGEPDIDGWLPDAGPLKIEVKTKTGSPTPRQIHALREYHNSGYYVAGVVTSVTELILLLGVYYTWWEAKQLDSAMPFSQILAEYGLGDEYGIYHEMD